MSEKSLSKNWEEADNADDDADDEDTDRHDEDLGDEDDY